MDTISIRTPGLGDATYLFHHEGVGIIVDPQRDVDRFLEAADGLDIAFIFETHLHNDYVSGGREAAKRTGADLVLPAAAAPAYRHRPAFHLEDLDAGPFSIRPLHTPGHTPEHTSYLVVVDGEPTAVFSGGSLLVGSAGRPDLLGEARADSLARLQYVSVHRLAELPQEVGLYPTHGEGSFCTASGAGRDVSTIGEEIRSNPVLAYPDEDSFVAGQLAGLQPYPSYYAYMGPANTFGYRDRGRGGLATMTAEDLAAREDTWIVDLRSKQAYADGHIPGSIGMEMGDQVGVWAGWLLPHDAEIVFVADESTDVEEAAAQFTRIGMDGVVGVLYGVDSWPEPLRSHRTITVEEARRELDAGNVTQLLDVRAPNEFADGALDGSVWSYLPDLVADMPDLDPSQPVWMMCRSGNRATIAVRWLEEAGYEPIVLIGGGVPDVMAA